LSDSIRTPHGAERLNGRLGIKHRTQTHPCAKCDQTQFRYW